MTKQLSIVTRVGLVGHCGFDAPQLERLVQAALPEATVHVINRQNELDEVAGEGCLLLINRVLDGRFDADDSLAMIRTYAEQDHGPRTMLISNYADSQDEAVAAGAVRGFGKNALGDPKTAEQIRHAARG
jgi:hypothetical protein